MKNHRPKSNVTLAICTFNRPKHLSALLAQLRDQFHETSIPILVVDNNSNQPKVGSLLKQAMEWGVESIVETRQGLSHARNRALSVARTKWVHFIDDDTSLPSNWLARIHDTYTQLPSTPKVVFAPYQIEFDERPPRWLKPEMLAFRPALSRGIVAGLIRGRGGNIGFDRKAAISCGGFSTELGMSGDTIGMGEETALQEALIERFGGKTMWFEPSLVNIAIVRASQATFVGASRRAAARGAARSEYEGRIPPQLVGRAAWALPAHFSLGLLRSLASLGMVDPRSYWYVHMLPHLEHLAWVLADGAAIRKSNARS